MGELSVWHWLLVGLVAVMLFGANRLPDVARSVGRSLRIFRAEMRGISEDGGTRVVDGAEEPAAGSDVGAPGGDPRRPGAE
jgi:sec-independent protein translocase protein TatA